MDNLEKLSHIFSEFPGIGARQAKRFAYFLTTRSPEFAESMAKLISDLKNEIRYCGDCSKIFQRNNSNFATCEICRDKNRDKTKLMIVSQDIDLEAVEKSGSYNGLYFVLGGVVPILEKNPESKIRLKKLMSRIENLAEREETEKLKEIIMGLNANPTGEHTADFLRNYLSSFSLKYEIKISTLGKGLSTGTELEYSDADTIKNALKNRA